MLWSRARKRCAKSEQVIDLNNLSRTHVRECSENIGRVCSTTIIPRELSVEAPQSIGVVERRESHSSAAVFAFPSREASTDVGGERASLKESVKGRGGGKRIVACNKKHCLLLVLAKDSNALAKAEDAGGRVICSYPPVCNTIAKVLESHHDVLIINKVYRQAPVTSMYLYLKV